MSLLESLFPEIPLEPTDVELLLEAFHNPVVRKYLKALGTEAAKELLALDILAETPETLHKKQTLVTGKLEVIGTLLSI